jgi:hypothetical protein
LYNSGYLLFCFAMSTTFADTTELELRVMPFAMSDEDPSDDEEKDEEEDADPDDADLEDLDEEEEGNEEEPVE